MPPLYKITMGNKESYAWSNEELKNITNGKSNYKVQRYKGLGEMNADQLCDTTMDPRTRSLIKINILMLLLLKKELVS